ncbi:hypothetical protein QJS10_CPB15g01858 [Acorus calamus]|uniref:Isopenicillin N synthase-like Fe(2+) 2OG dioxygenase domain-containing protein n=1 Tax=Acorus calamus TaxID=4465 RepID=A0AAV9D856_ACOCL|nr:hypothetical protein QJS10_CPB15g01858 [Acorus calamus]
MEGESEVIEPFELHHSDLLLLSSPSSSPSGPGEIEWLESVSRAVMKALGPSGPGLLAITGVERALELRRSLLSLSRRLALLDNDDRRRVLKDHGLGTDVSLKNPDRSVSSFVLHLNYLEDSILDLTSDGSSHEFEENGSAREGALHTDAFHELQYCEFKKLGSNFKDLGICMMRLGLRLAQVCDKAIGGQVLEKSILDSGSAKGRLIHYHSALDASVLRARGNKKETKSKEQQKLLRHFSSENSGIGVMRSLKPSQLDLWQQWHYDYGIFTVLTTPMFTCPCQKSTFEENSCSCMLCVQEYSPPGGHTYLQLFDANTDKILVVKTPPASFIVQVGESADILSKGKLRSTLHSVYKPMGLENVSRDTFVLFLQPAWNKTFSISDYPPTASTESSEKSISTEEMSEAISTDSVDKESHRLGQEIHRMIPPLFSRLKDGMTFAEFSRETTKQYYGGSGTQSVR